MTIEEFKTKQAEMSNEKLTKLAEKEFIKLCESGGRSIIMNAPPMTTDTDMLIYELIRRFKLLTNQNE